MVSQAEMERRHELVRESMRAHGVDVLVGASSAQWETRGTLRYLLDYSVCIFEEFVVLPLSGPVTFFGHYTVRARLARALPAVEEALHIPPEDLYTEPGRAIAEYVRRFNPKTVGLAGLGAMSARAYVSLVDGLSPTPTVDFTRRLEDVRMVKSNEEIELIEKAAKLNDDVMQAWISAIRPGGKELDAFREAAAVAKSAGAEEEFYLLGAGPTPVIRSPAQALRDEHVYKEGDLAILATELAGPGGYYGEIAKVVSIGEPREEVARAFDAVRGAQHAITEALRPGVTVGEVADIAINHITDAGFYTRNDGKMPRETGGQFVGHGQGLDVLEMPAIAPGDQTVIAAGMEINTHPSITLADGTNVLASESRIVTESGARPITLRPFGIAIV